MVSHTNLETWPSLPYYMINRLFCGLFTLNYVSFSFFWCCDWNVIVSHDDFSWSKVEIYESRKFDSKVRPDQVYVYEDILHKSGCFTKHSFRRNDFRIALLSVSLDNKRQKYWNEDFNVKVIWVLHKGSFIWYIRKIPRKTNISYPLIRMCACQEVRNFSISGNFAYVLNE